MDQTTDERTVRQIKRRELLKMLPLVAAGALAIPSVNEKFIAEGLHISDSLSENLFGSANLATVYADKFLTDFDKFPINSFSEYDPTEDVPTWKLIVEGMVAKPGEYTVEQIKALPKQMQNVKHVCVEGWNVIGNFGGAKLSDFLQLVGADPAAKFVEFSCKDEYYTSLDIASCRHPQTLLNYEMYGRPLAKDHGAPLRIHAPIKLGYKLAKHIYKMRVTNILQPEKGYWEDQGYSWYGGI